MAGMVRFADRCSFQRDALNGLDVNAFNTMNVLAKEASSR